MKPNMTQAEERLTRECLGIKDDDRVIHNKYGAGVVVDGWLEMLSPETFKSIDFPQKPIPIARVQFEDSEVNVGNPVNVLVKDLKFNMEKEK